MQNKFPTIKRIEDVLPAITGRDEFFVAEREGFTVINYTVAYETSFEIDETDLMDNYGDMIPTGIMRRECRGIIFDINGDIMSRPLHKFHNIGEREDTRIENIDMTRDHIIMEKMDGSMIRPMMLDGCLRLATKMGPTDVAAQAEMFLIGMKNSPCEWDMINQGAVDMSTNEYYTWLHNMINRGYTPLFEYVSSLNRIVLDYEKADLVLLAVRDNVTGEYLDIESLGSPFTTVKIYGAVSGTLDDYVAAHRNDEGREGFIIQFDDGQMVKGKNDWYVRIHRVKDKIRTDRHVLALLLENELDDVYPVLMEADFDRVKKYEADFHTALEAKLAFLGVEIYTALIKAGEDKKKLAVEILPASKLAKNEWSMAFKLADRGSATLNDLVMKYVRSKLGSTVKYNELAVWLGINKDMESGE